MLVLRAWTADGGLRARVTSTLDIERGDEGVEVAASADAVLAIVARWLEALVTPP